MWFFAHAGLTLGISVVAEHLTGHLQPEASPSNRQVDRTLALANIRSGSELQLPPVAGGSEGAKAWPGLSLARLAIPRLWPSFDYRLVIIGAILPDLDKFAGLLLFNNFDRAFLHSLFSLLLLLAAGAAWGIWLGDSRVLQLGWCWAIHLFLDQMWRRPTLFLWPFTGWDFRGARVEPGEVAEWMAYSLANDMGYLVPEVAGAAIVAGLLLWLVWHGRLGVFLRTGRAGAAHPSSS